MSTHVFVPSSAHFSKSEAIFSGQHLLESFKTANLCFYQEVHEIIWKLTHYKHLKLLQKLKQTSFKLQGELLRMYEKFLGAKNKEKAENQC